MSPRSLMRAHRVVVRLVLYRVNRVGAGSQAVVRFWEVEPGSGCVIVPDDLTAVIDVHGSLWEVAFSDAPVFGDE